MGCSKEFICRTCKTHWIIAYGPYGWEEPSKWFSDNHPAEHDFEFILDDVYSWSEERDALIEDYGGFNERNDDVLVANYSTWKKVDCQKECPENLTIEEWFKQQWNSPTSGESEPVCQSATVNAVAS